MYLIDTNILLEIFLQGERSPEAKRFLRITPFSNIYVTDLTIYSIGLALFKADKQDAYIQFLNDLFNNGEVWRVQLMIDNMPRVSEIAHQYQLNFHDAYQYVSAEIYSLILVSFNNVYDRTENGYKTPVSLMKEEV
jgi:predicted nucleic acid-binding protein